MSGFWKALIVIALLVVVSIFTDFIWLDFLVGFGIILPLLGLFCFLGSSCMEVSPIILLPIIAVCVVACYFLAQLIIYI